MKCRFVIDILFLGTFAKVCEETVQPCPNMGWLFPGTAEIRRREEVSWLDFQIWSVRWDGDRQVLEVRLKSPTSRGTDPCLPSDTADAIHRILEELGFSLRKEL